MFLSQRTVQGLRAAPSRQHRRARQVWQGQKPRSALLPHLRQALCRHPGQRPVWPAPAGPDHPPDHPSRGRGGGRAGHRAPAGAGQGHGQPGDPARRRALRPRALRPADFTGTDRDAARRVVDLFKKKKNSGSAADLERQYGRTWIWTAIDAPTRLLITFWIGGRELDDARRVLKDLTARSQDKPLFVSDELPHYGTVLGEL